MATTLGKEDAAFLPTGTLANNLGIRLLAGENRHVLVQEQSHLYRDESDSAQVLIASLLQRRQDAVERLAVVPGLGVDSAQQIIAEVRG
jgi:threonine aldolase